MKKEPCVLINTKMLAYRLGVGVDTLRRMERDGVLPKRVTKGYYNREEVDNYLNGKRTPPRLLNTKQLQDYLGVSWVTITKFVKQGILPPKVTGTSFWDRKAVDAHLDRVSGLVSENEDKSEYARWKQENHHEALQDDQVQAARRH